MTKTQGWRGRIGNSIINGDLNVVDLKGKGRLPLETWTGTSLRVRMRKEKEKGGRDVRGMGQEEPFQKSPSRPPPQQPPSKVSNQCPEQRED